MRDSPIIRSSLRSHLYRPEGRGHVIQPNNRVEARPKQAPQSPKRHLYRAAARTTTDRVHLGLVGSSYEIIAVGKGRFHDWNSRSDGGFNHCRQPRLAILAGVTSLAAAISTPAERDPACLRTGEAGFLAKKSQLGCLGPGKNKRRPKPLCPIFSAFAAQV